MTELRWRKRTGAILHGGSVKPGKEVVLGSDAFSVRPDWFTIYRKPSALMCRVREEKGKPPLIHVDRLPADGPANRPNSARSEPWQLPTPGHRLKWRLLFDDDQLHRSSILHVSRLGTVTPSLAPKASIPHVGEVGLFEIGLEVVASVDPTVELTVMTPWGREGADLRELLYEVAADAVDEEDDPGELTEALGSYLRPHLPGQPPPGWEFSLPRSRLQLAEGQRDQVALRLRAPTPGSTAFAVQMRALDVADWDASVSDVFIVEVSGEPSRASLLFAEEDPPAQASLHGNFSELVSWGRAAVARWIPRLR